MPRTQSDLYSNTFSLRDLHRRYPVIDAGPGSTTPPATADMRHLHQKGQMSRSTTPGNTLFLLSLEWLQAQPGGRYGVLHIPSSVKSIQRTGEDKERTRQGREGRENKFSLCKKGNTSKGYGRWSLYLSAIAQKENQVIWNFLLVAPTTLSCVRPHVSTSVHCHLNYAALHFPMFSLSGSILPFFHSLCYQLVHLIHLYSISPVHTINIQLIWLHMYLLHAGFDQDVCSFTAQKIGEGSKKASRKGGTALAERRQI